MKRTVTNNKYKDTEDVKTLKKIARVCSERALRESRVMGLTVKIIRNNQVIELYPDGSEKVVKTIEREPLKIKGLHKGSVLHLK
jgi:hypothetical protein